MRLVIASDVHGSATVCRRLIEIMNEERADRLVLLGDILYHGPRNPFPEEYAPQKVYEMLNAVKDRVLAVRGNCDSEVDQMVLAFDVSSDYAQIFDGKIKLTLSHGHRAVPPLSAGDVYLTGHTHVQENFYEEGGFLHLNPGSPALPKDGSRRAYILYEDGVFTFKTLQGEVFDVARVK